MRRPAAAAGTDGGLTKACEQLHFDEPWLCFMSPHMQAVIETPFFMFNSKYDAWQLSNELQVCPLARLLAACAAQHRASAFYSALNYSRQGSGSPARRDSAAPQPCATGDGDGDGDERLR